MLLKVDITPLHGIKPIWIGINIVTTVHSFLIRDGQWVSAHFMEKIVPPHKTSLSTLFCSSFLFVWTVLWPLLNAFDLTRRVEYWTITVECSCVWQRPRRRFLTHLACWAEPGQKGQIIDAGRSNHPARTFGSWYQQRRIPRGLKVDLTCHCSMYYYVCHKKKATPSAGEEKPL